MGVRGLLSLLSSDPSRYSSKIYFHHHHHHDDHDSDYKYSSSTSGRSHHHHHQILIDGPGLMHYLHSTQSNQLLLAAVDKDLLLFPREIKFSRNQVMDALHSYDYMYERTRSFLRLLVDSFEYNDDAKVDGDDDSECNYVQHSLSIHLVMEGVADLSKLNVQLQRMEKMYDRLDKLRDSLDGGRTDYFNMLPVHLLAERIMLQGFEDFHASINNKSNNINNNVTIKIHYADGEAEDYIARYMSHHHHLTAPQQHQNIKTSVLSNDTDLLILKGCGHFVPLDSLNVVKLDDHLVLKGLAYESRKLVSAFNIDLDCLPYVALLAGCDHQLGQKELLVIQKIVNVILDNMKQQSGIRSKNKHNIPLKSMLVGIVRCLAFWQRESNTIVAGSLLDAMFSQYFPSFYHSSITVKAILVQILKKLEGIDISAITSRNCCDINEKEKERINLIVGMCGKIFHQYTSAHRQGCDCCTFDSNGVVDDNSTSIEIRRILQNKCFYCRPTICSTILSGEYGWNMEWLKELRRAIYNILIDIDTDACSLNCIHEYSFKKGGNKLRKELVEVPYNSSASSHCRVSLECFLEEVQTEVKFNENAECAFLWVSRKIKNEIDYCEPKREVTWSDQEKGRRKVMRRLSTKYLSLYHAYLLLSALKIDFSLPLDLTQANNQ